MECGSGGGLNEFEKRREDEDHHHHKQETDVEEPPVADTDRSMVEAETTTFLAKREKVDDQLETTKSQMDEVREENEHLKRRLNKIMNEYRALEVQFHNMAKQARKKNVDNKGIDEKHQEIIEEPDLVSLSLGRVPSNLRNDEKIKVSKPLVNGEFKEELALGLDCKFETSKSGSTTEGLPNPSPVNSFEGPKEEAGETLTPSKAPKTIMRDTEDEVAQEIPTKKTRVCVRARCDTLTMNDGCQWRKYGQKIAKGNPCPRAYYRCTVAPSCPVRKQVQRCVEDMSILITTYEGTHNHTLPLSATAMASTTSAAASMLLSGSSTSQSGSTFANNNNSNLHGLNFYLSDGSKTNQLYLSNPALSSSQSHPTITLDLTASNHHQGSSSSSSLSPFVRFASTQPRYPSSTSLSFSSPESNIMSWNNNNSNSSTFLNYNNTRQQPYSHNRNNINLSTLNFGRPETMENIYQSYMQKNINTTDQTSISAATKAITADPTFQSALAAALSSFINGGVGGINNNNTQLGAGEKQDLGQKMKWAEMFSAAASNSISTTLLPSTSKVVNNIGCASSSLSLLNKMPAGNTTVLQTTGSLMLLPPHSLPLSTAKSASASPRDNNSSDDTN